MTTLTAPPATRAPTARSQTAGSSRTALATLTRRRMLLSAHTPREIIVPLMTPVLFATVIAPALAKTAHAVSGIDYQSFVALGTVGLLVPLSCMFAGIGAIVDRQQGAQRDLLAAPAPRSFMVFGNLAVALFVSAIQLAALLVFASLRGAHFSASMSGGLWFAGAAFALAVTMYAIAEIFATRLPSQEEYVGLVPAVAIVPWFLAGSLFPIPSLPPVLAAFAKVLPLTHALALMRYGLIDAHGHGLHDIWGMHNTALMASLSLLVVAAYAVLFLALSVRVFTRGVVQ
jgi:ABC-type polysaccharide/polyol phosphate export permease